MAILDLTKAAICSQQQTIYTIQKIMSSPRKIKSKLIEDLRTHRDPGQSRRIRTSMIIAARIASALREKGWNKIRLASELNKSPSLVTRWLSGNHNFTTDTLSDIQDILGVRLSLHFPPFTASRTTAVSVVKNGNA